MDAKLVREYRARYEGVAQIEAAKRRAATIEERWEKPHLWGEVESLLR